MGLLSVRLYHLLKVLAGLFSDSSGWHEHNHRRPKRLGRVFNEKKANQRLQRGSAPVPRGSLRRLLIVVQLSGWLARWLLLHPTQAGQIRPVKPRPFVPTTGAARSLFVCSGLLDVFVVVVVVCALATCFERSLYSGMGPKRAKKACRPARSSQCVPIVSLIVREPDQAVARP